MKMQTTRDAMRTGLASWIMASYDADEVLRAAHLGRGGCCCDACNPEFHSEACACCEGAARR